MYRNGTVAERPYIGGPQQPSITREVPRITGNYCCVSP